MPCSPDRYLRTRQPPLLVRKLNLGPDTPLSDFIASLSSGNLPSRISSEYRKSEGVVKFAYSSDSNISLLQKGQAQINDFYSIHVKHEYSYAFV